MAQNLKRLMKRFGDEMGKLAFADPVAYVYNPLDYAWAGQEAFIHRFFGRPPDAATNEDDPEPRPTMLVGMNPGPYGMTQSGVAFGAPKLVRHWMEIDLPPDAIHPPAVVCPTRPIFGFSPVPITATPTAADTEVKAKKKKRKRAAPRPPALREEVSGKRIYADWAMNTYSSADAFFKEFYIHPYCPLQFMAASGTNITPDQLRRDDRAELYEVCDRYLREAIELLRPKRVIGIGNFADERIRDTLKRWREEQEEAGDENELLEKLVVGKIPHPRHDPLYPRSVSRLPRSPLARVVWGNRASKVNELLRGFGVDVPYTVPAIASVADDGQEEVDVDAEMDEEEGDTNAPRKDKRQKNASRPARTSTSRTRASGRVVAGLALTKRRLRAQNINK